MAIVPPPRPQGKFPAPARPAARSPAGGAIPWRFSSRRMRATEGRMTMPEASSTMVRRSSIAWIWARRSGIGPDMGRRRHPAVKRYGHANPPPAPVARGA